jgi:hypothetical protein
LNVRRLPLTSLLVALLAVSGGWAAPLKGADSARLIAAIVCLDRREAEPQAIALARAAHARSAPARLTPRGARTLVTRDLPHALDQRPPPRL